MPKRQTVTAIASAFTIPTPTGVFTPEPFRVHRAQAIYGAKAILPDVPLLELAYSVNNSVDLAIRRAGPLFLNQLGPMMPADKKITAQNLATELAKEIVEEAVKEKVVRIPTARLEATEKSDEGNLVEFGASVFRNMAEDIGEHLGERMKLLHKRMLALKKEGAELAEGLADFVKRESALTQKLRMSFVNHLGDLKHFVDGLLTQSATGTFVPHEELLKVADLLNRVNEGMGSWREKINAMEQATLNNDDVEMAKAAAELEKHEAKMAEEMMTWFVEQSQGCAGGELHQCVISMDEAPSMPMRVKAMLDSAIDSLVDWKEFTNRLHKAKMENNEVEAIAAAKDLAQLEPVLLERSKQLIHGMAEVWNQRLFAATGQESANILASGEKDAVVGKPVEDVIEKVAEVQAEDVIEKIAEAQAEDVIEKVAEAEIKEVTQVDDVIEEVAEAQVETLNPAMQQLESQSRSPGFEVLGWSLSASDIDVSADQKKGIVI